MGAFEPTAFSDAFDGVNPSRADAGVVLCSKCGALYVVDRWPHVCGKRRK